MTFFPGGHPQWLASLGPSYEFHSWGQPPISLLHLSYNNHHLWSVGLMVLRMLQPYPGSPKSDPPGGASDLSNHQTNQLQSSDGALPTTARRAKRESGGLGNPPGSLMTIEEPSSALVRLPSAFYRTRTILFTRRVTYSTDPDCLARVARAFV
jgi:hypothetical protein